MINAWSGNVPMRYAYYLLGKLDNRNKMVTQNKKTNASEKKLNLFCKNDLTCSDKIGVVI